MTEKEYVIATNRVKISAALMMCSDVLAGDDYGITKDELLEITSRLSIAQDELFSQISIVA